MTILHRKPTGTAIKPAAGPHPGIRLGIVGMTLGIMTPGTIGTIPGTTIRGIPPGTTATMAGILPGVMAIMAIIMAGMEAAIEAGTMALPGARGAVQEFHTTGISAVSAALTLMPVVAGWAAIGVPIPMAAPHHGPTAHPAQVLAARAPVDGQAVALQAVPLAVAAAVAGQAAGAPWVAVTPMVADANGKNN